MKFTTHKRLILASLVIGAAALSGCSTMKEMMPGMHSSMQSKGDNTVSLAGSQEVPPVQTGASGSMSYTVTMDHTVSGSVQTSGINGTAAHIHEGAPGKNGPVIIPLTSTGGGGWMVPAGTKITNAQHESYKAGNWYVNVHSAAHPGGEIRAQLK